MDSERSDHPTTAEEDVAPLLRGYSVEVTARDRSAAGVCRSYLAPGTEVYIAFVPGDSHHTTLEAAARLHDAGFIPVPHIVARNVVSFTQASDFLARLNGEAGVTRALVVAGDTNQPAGPYHSSLHLLQTGLFQNHGVRRVGIAWYPEAHRSVHADQLNEALAAKLDLVRKEGLEGWLVSQLCFEAAPIIERAARLRALGITEPLRVGIAGPADRRTLWKYALHCGIGNSIRALGTRVDAISNLLTRDTPDRLLAELAAALRRRPALGIEGVHIYTFGGVAGAATWADALLAGARGRRS